MLLVLFKMSVFDIYYTAFKPYSAFLKDFHFFLLLPHPRICLQ